MRKTIIISGCAFVLLILLFSCQKEVSESLPTGGGGSSAGPDSTYLDSLYEFETLGAVTDTTSYYAYKYDAQKRVTSMKWEWGEFQLPYDDSGSIQYSYIGADTLPYKSYMIATFNGMTVFDTATTFYTYDASGRVIKDSTVDSEEDRDIFSPYYRVRKFVNSYIYVADKVIMQASDIPVIEPTPIIYPAIYNRDTTILDAAQNPVSAVYYRSFNANSGYVKDFSASAVFDTKPNPFQRLNISKSFSPVLAYNPDFSFGYGTKNIFLSYTFIPDAGSPSTEIFSNTYQMNGYAKKTIFPGTTEGVLYKYKIL